MRVSSAALACWASLIVGLPLAGAGLWRASARGTGWVEGRRIGSPFDVGERSQRDSLCGRPVRHPTLITRSGVGPIRPEMSIEEVRRLCPGAVDTTDQFYSVAAVRLHAFGSEVLVIPDAAGLGRVGPASGPVLAIRVVGGALVTPEHLGPGSTLRQLRRAYGKAVFEMCGARPLGASFRTRPGMLFMFAPLANCSEGRTDPNVSVPDSLRVAAVEVFRHAP